MAVEIIAPEQAEELHRQREAYAAATQRAVVALKDGGMSSEAFAKADAEAGKAAARIREILGLGKHWMS